MAVTRRATPASKRCSNNVPTIHTNLAQVDAVSQYHAFTQGGVESDRFDFGHADRTRICAPLSAWPGYRRLRDHFAIWRDAPGAGKSSHKKYGRNPARQLYYVHDLCLPLFDLGDTAIKHRRRQSI